MYSGTDANELILLFKGSERGIGVTSNIATKKNENGKIEGRSGYLAEPLTPSIMNKHCTGEMSIGIAPLTDNDTCYFAAIDIDEYHYDLLDIVRAIYEYQMPIVPCYSKSKHLHLFFFFSDEAPADEIIDYLKWYRMAFACLPKTEIYPKQSHVSSATRYPSWINLPYFEADNPDNCRKMITDTGDLADIHDFIDRAKSVRYTLKQHLEWLDSFKYHDAPPCVIAGLLLHDIGPGERNNWLFAVGVYLKLKDENVDLETELIDINKALHDPIDEKELQITVIQGMERKSYFYPCSQLNRCNKVYCKQVEHGISSKESTGLTFEELTQVQGDPPYYIWKINGQELEFYSEREILRQSRFQELCMRKLHLVPRLIPEEKWHRIVGKAMQNVIVRDDITAGFTEGQTFLNIVYAFFDKNSLTDNKALIKMGRIYKEDNYYLFDNDRLKTHIVSKNGFRAYSGGEIQRRILQLGASFDGVFWKIPTEVIPSGAIPEPVVNFPVKEYDDVNF